MLDMGATATRRNNGRRDARAVRPGCPTHPTGDVILDGYFQTWNRKQHRRPRYRCRYEPGHRGHVFSMPTPVRRPTHAFPHTGGACPTCEHEYERHEGVKTPKRFLFGHQEIAEALIKVGQGRSMRGASADLRDAIERHIAPKQPSNEGHLAAEYIDHYGALVVDALMPKQWPAVIGIDSLPLRTRGYRDGVQVGDLEAGEIMVAVDYTVRPPVPCLIQVQGGKDATSWKAFFASLSGAPEWITADNDLAIAKAVRETWPETVLFHSRDHLARRLQLCLAADEVPRTVPIERPAGYVEPPRGATNKRGAVAWPFNQPKQEWTDHPLWAATGWAQSNHERWAQFKALVERHIDHRHTATRAWIESNDSLVGVQILLAEDHPQYPVGSGGTEGVIREKLGTSVKRRAGRFQNTRRLNLILGLMALDGRRAARISVYASIVRAEQDRHGGYSGVTNWRRWQDTGGSSLAWLVHDADERQAAAERAAKNAAAELRRMRTLQAADAERAAAGLGPVKTGKRNWGRPSPKEPRSVRGKFVADFPELLADWDWLLNTYLDPAKVRGSSRGRVFWRCHRDPDHVWDARVTDRATRHTDCPYCMGQRCHPKESLAAEWPKVAAEWNISKNLPLLPDQVLPGSGRKVWWTCKADHTWDAYVFSRTKQSHGCPECARLRRTKRSGRAKRSKKLIPVV